MIFGICTFMVRPTQRSKHMIRCQFITTGTQKYCSAEASKVFIIIQDFKSKLGAYLRFNFTQSLGQVIFNKILNFLPSKGLK